MSKALKLTFDTEESTRTIVITNPKADVSADDCEAAMTAIAESHAFVGITDPVNAVLVETNAEEIYAF